MLVKFFYIHRSYSFKLIEVIQELNEILWYWISLFKVDNIHKNANFISVDKIAIFLIDQYFVGWKFHRSVWKEVQAIKHYHPPSRTCLFWQKQSFRSFKKIKSNFFVIFNDFQYRKFYVWCYSTLSWKKFIFLLWLQKCIFTIYKFDGLIV